MKILILDNTCLSNIIVFLFMKILILKHTKGIVCCTNKQIIKPNKQIIKPIKQIIKPNTLYFKQISTELLIESVIIPSVSILCEVSKLDILKQMCIAYQNDVILVTTSSFVKTFLTRAILYFITGFISSTLCDFFIYHNLFTYCKLHIGLGLSMAILSNIRYILVHKLEHFVYKNKNDVYTLFSFGLRIFNNCLGSLQYLTIVNYFT